MPAARSQPNHIDDEFERFLQSLDLEPSYDTAGVGVLLKKSPSTVERLVRRGELRAFKVGQTLTFFSRDIATMLFRRVHQPTPLPDQQPKPPQKRVIPHPSLGVEARRKKKQEEEQAAARRGRKRTGPVYRVKQGARS